MGQYHRVVNLDKKEVIFPHKFDNGLKLLEFGCSQNGTMTGLAILLACSNNRGGGDLVSDNPLIGSWAGDRIAIVGDYWEQSEAEASGIPTWDDIEADYTDISIDVLRAMCEDEYLKDELLESFVQYEWSTLDGKELFTEEEIAAKKMQLEKKGEK